MRQTKKSSYTKLFSALNETEDSFEVDILNRIQEDYLKYHENHLADYLHLLSKELYCPNCRSTEIIKYGKIKVDQYAINASHVGRHLAA